MDTGERNRDQLLLQLDSAHAQLGAGHLHFFQLIGVLDRTEAWADDGARDVSHWLWMRYGMSDWKSRRFVAAAHALEHLPATTDALRRGLVGVDKVVELARFATPETEDGLLTWAAYVSAGRIREEGDLLRRAAEQEAAHDDEVRSVTWWFTDEGRRFEMQANLPAAQGASVAKAIDRITASIPSMPDEQGGAYAQARRADALVALCSSHLAGDADQERATVVIHARTGESLDAPSGSQIEGGGVAPPSTLDRLLCSARIEAVHEDGSGRALGVGRITRVPPAWMLRQVRYRDSGCRFPGCGTRAFTQAHHIVFWRDGGTTDLSNLVLLCTWHHKLVHEHGWWIKGDAEDELRWYRPDGTRHRAGPEPIDAHEAQPALELAG